MPDSEVATVEMCEQHAHLRGLSPALWESPTVRDRNARLRMKFAEGELLGHWHVTIYEGLHGAEGRTLDG